MKMKKLLAILFLSAACSLFAQKYLYTIEISPENLADIDPRQNAVLKTVENKKAIFIIGEKINLFKAIPLETETTKQSAATAIDNSKIVTKSIRSLF